MTGHLEFFRSPGLGTSPRQEPRRHIKRRLNAMQAPSRQETHAFTSSPSEVVAHRAPCGYKNC